MPNSYRLKDFVAHHHAGKLVTPLRLTGMVKIQDGGESLLFSPTGKCEKWIPIPGEFIESIEYLGESRCGDHGHPIVHLLTREPDDKDVLATFLSHVLRELVKHQETSNSANWGQPDLEESFLVRHQARRSCFDQCMQSTKNWRFCRDICRPKLM